MTKLNTKSVIKQHLPDESGDIEDVELDYSKYSGDNYLENNYKRVERYSIHKDRNIRLVDEYDSVLGKALSNKVLNCRNFLHFRNYIVDKKIKLVNTLSCQNSLLCPMCSIARANKHLGLYKSKVRELQESYRLSGRELSFFYVVLTIKNGNSLDERFTHLEKSVRNLIKRRGEYRKALNGKESSKYALNTSLKDVVAGAYSIEIKRGKGKKQWHPHINLALLVDGDISIKKLKEEWNSITGDSKIVYCKKKTSEIDQVFIEVFKYSLKFSEVSLEDNVEIWRVLAGRKLIGSFGEFRGLKVPKEDIESDDGKVFFDMLYKYNQLLRKYTE